MAERKDLWISGNEASEILTKLSGHPVSSDYVRLLSNTGKIRAKSINKRSKKYHRGDVESYRVRGNGKNRKQPAEQREENRSEIVA